MFQRKHIRYVVVVGFAALALLLLLPGVAGATATHPVPPAGTCALGGALGGRTLPTTDRAPHGAACTALETRHRPLDGSQTLLDIAEKTQRPL